MKLRFSSHHFVVAILALLAVNAYAYDFESDGIRYNVLSEEDRTVEVISNKYYDSYRGNIVIPDRVLKNGRIYTVTSIGERAFSYCDALTSVEFPASLTTIESYAFFECDYLTSVDLSSTSLTSIGVCAFSYCAALTSVEFPSSLTSIGESAFYDCNALTSVDLSSTSLTSIGREAFSGCDALTSVDLSSTSLTSIDSGAFYGCDALTSVEFPASLTSIKDDAFSYCAALTSVELPVSLTSIKDDAFRGCTSLSNLTVDEDNPVFTSRDNVLYSKDLDTLVCYPTGTDTVVVIPDGVRSIREDAFPGKVSAVYCQPQTPPEAVKGYFSDMFSDDELLNAVLYVPIGTKAAYMKVDPWRNFWNIEETDFSTVGINGVTAQSEPLVTVRGGKIVVEGASTTGVIEVFSADGRCAYRGTGTVIEGLPKGAYVVRVGKFSQKLVL